MARLVYLRNVTTLEIDSRRCVGCGECVTVCPHPVLSLIDGRSSIVDRDACMECGACSRNCAVGAISVRAGVGCAAAVINSALGRTGDCCCSIDSTCDEAPEAADSGCC
jgi:NAD-dependent dihydropyrimidine dehydrogenase PreA subunit